MDKGSKVLSGDFEMVETNAYYRKYLELEGVPNDKEAFKEFVEYEQQLVAIYGGSVLNEGSH